MLEKLLSRSGVEEKKRMLTEEYGLIMTAQLEGRMQTMCNWSEAIQERSYQEGMEEGIEKGMEKERLNAIGRMLRADLTKTQIISCGYTEKELAEAESILS